MNTNVDNFLNYYVKQPNPRYAVMVMGPWGCGKTHFIKRWAKNLAVSIDTDDLSTLTKPIYISLFGLSSIQQVNDAITREVYPILKSRIYKIGKLALNAVSNVTLNCDISKLIKGKEKISGEASLELDLVSFFQSDSNNKHENRIIVFDDFERCSVDFVDMLGYFNQFVEHSNIRVVIVCNEDEIKGDNKYERFKEKLVGRSFKIEPETISAISDFCNTPGITQLSKEQQLIVKDVFDKVGHKNLRSLYQGLQDFSGLLNKLNYDNSNIRQKEYLNRLLIQYVVAYCEFPANETVRGIAFKEPSGINISRFNFITGNPNDNEADLLSKYEAFFGYTPSSWVFDNPMPYILHSIVDGGDISNILDAQLNQKEEEETIFQRLSRFLTMENTDFDANYTEALNYITSSDSDIILIIQTISTLLTIDNRNIRKIDDAIINRSKDNVRDIVSKFKDLKKFREWKEQRFDRIQIEIKNFGYNQRLKEYANNIEKLVEYKLIELENEEIQGLKRINNDNFDSVIAVYFHQYGSIAVPRYVTRPLFNSINPNDFAITLSMLNNENKMKFRNLLLERYETQQSVALSVMFGAEIQSLKEISKQLDIVSVNKEDIDKWEIEELSRTFEKAVCLINSDV